MNNIWIMFFVVIFGSGIRSDEIKLGELVEQNGAWEQNGVILILHQINFDGTLFKFRAGFRNTNALWIQIWTQIEFSGKTMNFRLENQWKYGSSTFDIVTVNLPEGELKIGAGQHIGVYFPSDGLMALRFKAVNPKYPLYGSDYIPASRILSLGEYLKFGYIGYLNKISIEFYIRSDGPTRTTRKISAVTTSATMITETTTRTTTYMSDDITSTRTSTYNSINTTLMTFSEPTSSTKSLTEGRQNTVNSNQLTDKKTNQVLIISLAVTFAVLLLFGITLGCVLFRRHRREADASNRRYVQTNNPMYGLTLTDADPRQTQQPGIELSKVKNEVNASPTTGNIHNTVTSGIYEQMNEAEMIQA